MWCDFAIVYLVNQSMGLISCIFAGRLTPLEWAHVVYRETLHYPSPGLPAATKNFCRANPYNPAEARAIMPAKASRPLMPAREEEGEGNKVHGGSVCAGGYSDGPIAPYRVSCLACR